MQFDRAKYVEAYLQDTHRILRDMEADLKVKLSRLADVLEKARREDRIVFTMGNGGSASAASHFANDLNKYTITEGEKRYRCVALTDNLPVLLAVANDIGYEDVFVEQLKNLSRPGDVLLGISGSGNSKNCLKAHAWAKENGLVNVTWTGYGGGKMAPYGGDLAVVIPSHSMVRCEDTHLIVHHMLTSMLKGELEARHGRGYEMSLGR
ncbi:MAG TPA: SIS domain-containing protein [Candidatus Thermoplasmatota archaeon]|nr:SIS domain-containing protein [Candidatus Thermoplasmatota archaeon]